MANPPCQFHRSDNYTREPALGGMKIDLFKLSILVKINGGFQKVTAERAWKKLADYFDFPPTCTNSAFVMKKIYVQTLKDFIAASEVSMRTGASIGGSVLSPYNQKTRAGAADETSSDDEVRKIVSNRNGGKSK